jgi:ATP-dependent RNA helicase HelY
MEVRDEFVASLGFEPDPFQVRAMDALDAGRSVLVAAPTGSGKTVVAEYAVARAIAAGRKAFYTTPLKALSNQKYGDLVRRHGHDRVGLLTGDNAINGDAPIVVMTTEVLRNMIYAGSSSLAQLRYVVLDEVHYLQNPYRGPVWEEVIIHLPHSVSLVALSATVSNAEEVADWMGTVRGATEAVIEERRPVELHNLYMVGDRAGSRPLLLPTLVDGRPNPEAAALDSAQVARSPRNRGMERGANRRGRLVTPRRADVVERLGEEDMLPAIFFIFSRKACDEAVASCLREGVRLTSPEERSTIRAIAEAHVEHLSDTDLRVLRYGEWLSGLEQGLAAHHAGMVPPFKEAVEHCFELGLVKVVFATETLSLGINMPARSVVIEKLTKFTGERHEPLTPGEYTQLTGRAGRRGIDEVGYAIVLWSPFVPFDQVAGLASTRTYALSSSFRPTFNMACNLVRRYPPAQAHHLLNLSFAQYRTDSDVVRLEAHLERAQEALAEARTDAVCDRGDLERYRGLVRSAEEATRHRPSDRQAVQHALEKVRPGDVLVLPGNGARAVVVSSARRKGGEVRLGLLTQESRKLQLAGRDFPGPPRLLGRVELPRPYLPDDKAFRARAVSALSAVEVVGTSRSSVGAAAERRTRRRGAEAMRQAEAAAADPVATCPDLRRHLRAADRVDRLEREVERLQDQVKGRSESLARQFDRVLRVLAAWGYVDGWSLTEAGERLGRLYHEADLLVAETLHAGLFDGLDPPGAAALASCFTYESRGQESPAAWLPTRELKDRWTQVQELARDLVAAEDEAGLPHTRLPDAGFAAYAYDWAAGRDLERLLSDQELSGGDFVRNVKQLIDLLRQLGDVAPVRATGAACRSAADALFRGVVAASSVVTSGADDSGGKPQPAAGS